MNPDRAEIKAYARRVETMRALQRRFFAGDRSVVGEAKRHEREVDKLTLDLLTSGPSLFDPPARADPVTPEFVAWVREVRDMVLVTGDESDRAVAHFLATIEGGGKLCD